MSVVYAASEGLGVGWLDTAGPLLVWVIVLSFVFVECALIVGLFLPGDSLLFAAGVVLASHDADANAWLLSVAALVVAVVGNQVGYYIGRHTGTRFIARRGGRVLNRGNLERARAFLDRKGFFAVVAARWIPWVRTLAPLIAGAARMDPKRFLLATFLGGLLWVPTLVLLGYYGAGLLDALPWLKTVVVWLSVAFFVGGTAFGVVRYRQEMRRPVDDPGRDAGPELREAA
ncbi:membrane-associated protein [Amycolatopsis bartoniae]|uniref:Membrane protein n=1 Tax=Amycolatopsis bartoniae TaxID=941986 RepID=A0A8H9M5E5_9PSEU|nr:DedA family protein [Amycolatopsis bartoniae]MBB2933005.1 membrane-associated protein [Amycolatopsis bartoniae]TVT03382.1 DedA family protein [Amycolatopsis bartoniae]GHF56321.1 membrane protein [Amycolatopsis bartoniae]